MLELALEQLDQQALAGELLVRADGAGATHELTWWCRKAGICFSVGFDLTEDVREAIAAVPEAAWERAIRADSTECERSQVAEITGPRGALRVARGRAPDRPAHEAARGRPAVVR